MESVEFYWKQKNAASSASATGTCHFERRREVTSTAPATTVTSSSFCLPPAKVYREVMQIQPALTQFSMWSSAHATNLLELTATNVASSASVTGICHFKRSREVAQKITHT